MSYEFTPNQEELCEALRDLGVEQELAEVLLTILDEDSKADEYLDWLVENQDSITESTLLQKAMEVDEGLPFTMLQKNTKNS